MCVTPAIDIAAPPDSMTKVRGNLKQTFTDACIPHNAAFYSLTMAGQLLTAIVVTFRLSKPLALFSACASTV